MFKEFRDFLLKGNVVDMAVGFIFGAAFATIVKSLVSNVIMPPIGLLLVMWIFHRFSLRWMARCMLLWRIWKKRELLPLSWVSFSMTSPRLSS